MNKTLEEITKYLTEEKRLAITEIEKFKKLKYETLSILEKQDSRYKKHIFFERYPSEVKISTTCLGHLCDKEIDKIALSELSREIIERKCVICRQNIYGKIEDPNYRYDNSENIIPRSIYEKSKKYGEYSLEEINKKLYNLYIRYQILSQVSYNICTLFGHNREYHHSSEFECTRCEMIMDTYHQFRYFKISTINPREIGMDCNDIALLSFLHLDYTFDSSLPELSQWKHVLSLNKETIIRELCKDIEVVIKEEDIVVEDEVFSEIVEERQKQEKNKVKIKKIDPSKTWY